MIHWIRKSFQVTSYDSETEDANITTWLNQVQAQAWQALPRASGRVTVFALTQVEPAPAEPHADGAAVMLPHHLSLDEVIAELATLRKEKVHY